MSGGHNHCEIKITNLKVPKENMLGGQGQGHRLGQARLGPARLAHCMRWIGQAEVALNMMIERSLNRFAHGSLLAEKQGIQWMIADSTMELYQSKLMVLHAAYKIDNGHDFKSEVSMAKHFVANALGRIVDRAIQVHGALGYSTDSPLSGMATQARWARFADGADEIHQWRIGESSMIAGMPRIAIATNDFASSVALFRDKLGMPVLDLSKASVPALGAKVAMCVPEGGSNIELMCPADPEAPLSQSLQRYLDRRGEGLSGRPSVPGAVGDRAGHHRCARRRSRGPCLRPAARHGDRGALSGPGTRCESVHLPPEIGRAHRARLS